MGRTLSLRNKTGKTLLGVVGAAAGLLAGIDPAPVIELITEPVIQTQANTMDLNLIDIALMAATALVGFFTTRGLAKGLLKNILTELADVIDAARKGREASSPGGKEYTQDELNTIFRETEDVALVLYRKLIRSRIAGWLGIKKQPPKQP